MTKRRVVITGLGIVCPVGNSVVDAWENLLAGKSGIAPISRFDVSAFPVRFGGEVKDFEVTEYSDDRRVRKASQFIHYALAAAHQALSDSGVEITDSLASRVGVAIGSGIGGLTGIEDAHHAYLEGGPHRIWPFFVPANIINMAAGAISMVYGLQGPNIATATACASGTHSIGVASRMIAYGDADVMVAGGAEMPICPTGVGGFAAARALSQRNDDPEGASRPWDRGRDGFVLAEGAGVLLLEEYELARSRGAQIYAEIAGFGMSGDAYHMTQPSVDGEGAAACMRNAFADAKMAPGDVGYINAHATSTPAGDLVETRAIKAVFGAAAADVAVSSTKSMTGHLLGAAGGVEAVFTALALRDQVVPPTINLMDPDPDCDLDYVPHVARDLKIDAAMSNSFAFGGTNGTLILRRAS